MVTLRRLKYFIKVVATRNITQAAEQLHVAQPALGAHMRALEAHYGVELLQRHSRGVEPTPAGLLLQARAEAVFDLLDRSEQELRRLGGAPQVAFDLGLTTSLMLLIGTELLVSVAQSHPAVALRLHENPSFLLTEALERREIHAALAYCVDRQAGFSCTPVLREQMLFVRKAGPEAGGGPIGIAEVLSHDLVLGNERDVARRLLAAASESLGVPARVKYESQSIVALRELVLHGAACTILPMGSIAREVDRGDVVARPIEDPCMLMTLYVLRRADTWGAGGPEAEAADRMLERCVGLVAQRLGDLARPA